MANSVQQLPVIQWEPPTPPVTYIYPTPVKTAVAPAPAKSCDGAWWAALTMTLMFIVPFCIAEYQRQTLTTPAPYSQVK